MIAQRRPQGRRNQQGPDQSQGRPEDGHHQSSAQASEIAQAGDALLPAWPRPVCHMNQVNSFLINNTRFSRNAIADTWPT
jgi:hypothetical protein